MAETLHQHDIDIKDTTPDWVKQQIEDVYKETNNNLSGLKDKISNNTLEKELTLDHVKAVLDNALDKFNNGQTLKEVYGRKTTAGPEGMGSGLNISVQIILKKLGIDPGDIDGFYGTKTKKAVENFQDKWNKDHPNDKITKDGWAGQETIKRIIESFNKNKNEGTTITGIISEPNNTLQEKFELSKKLLDEISTQYSLPDNIARSAEYKDYVSLKSNVIITGTINGEKIKISFDQEENQFTNILSKNTYSNPILISGQDKFTLESEDVLNKTALKIVSIVEGSNPAAGTGTDITNPSTGTEVTNPSTGTDITNPSTGTEVTNPSTGTDITNISNPDIEKQLQEAFKNSEFIFEGNYPAAIENDIKTSFNDAKQGLGLEGNYSIQLTNNSVPGQETIADHNTIDLKNELNGDNQNSLVVAFIKIKGKDVNNFKIKLTKTNQENKKIFTVSTISSVEQFAYDKEIINKLKNNKRLPQDWTKLDPAVTFDLNEPFNFYLNVKNGENKEEIIFDKEGDISENQIVLLNNKTYKRNDNSDLLTLEEVSTTPETLETLKQNLLTEFDKPLDNTYHPYLQKVYSHEIKNLKDNINGSFLTTDKLNNIEQYLLQIRENKETPRYDLEGYGVANIFKLSKAFFIDGTLKDGVKIDLTDPTKTQLTIENKKIDFALNGDLQTNEITLNNKTYTIKKEQNRLSLESTDFTDEARENIDFWNKETICNALNISPNYIKTFNKTDGKTILETKARDERSMVLKNIENLGKNKIISGTNLFLLNTKREFAGNNKYKASIELREMSKEEADLHKKYIFNPINMISSVQKNNEKISVQTNQGYSLEFNDDYTNPVLIYGDKKYGIQLKNNEIKINSGLLPSLTNFPLDNILINENNINKDDIKIDLYENNKIDIYIPLGGNELTPISFLPDGTLKNTTVNGYDIIIEDGGLQITKVTEGEQSLEYIENTMKAITKDLSINEDGSLKINKNINILTKKQSLDTYTEAEINKIKTKVGGLSDKNSIKNNFDEMMSIRDLAKTTLENYQKVFDKQVELEEKRYKIEADDNGNITSLIKDKRIGKDKPYITSNNGSINIGDLSKVIEDID